MVTVMVTPPTVHLLSERCQGKTVARCSPVQSKVNPTGVLGFIPVYLPVGTPQCEEVPRSAGYRAVFGVSAGNQPVAICSTKGKLDGIVLPNQIAFISASNVC